jgi:7-cyano-7-deazaguanine synthase
VTSKRAIVLLSGGLDSATVLAIAKEQQYRCIALSFQYGQKHGIELASARKVCAAHGVDEHLIQTIDLRMFGGSALTDDALVVPADRHGDLSTEIPITYVPARNTIFLSFALALAEVRGVNDIFIGANAVDFSGYPDCRPQYLDALEKMANLATRVGVEHNSIRIRAPIVDMTKADIIRTGTRLGVDYALTWSCYSPDDGKACGHCDACSLRRDGFVAAGVADPTPYAQQGPR